MRVNFVTGIFFVSALTAAGILTTAVIPFLATIPLIRRKIIIIVEIAIISISLLILYYTSRFYFYPYSFRGLLYVNLYFIASEYIDKASIVDVLGEAGVPIAVALSYYPYLTSIVRDVVFYSRARKKNVFRVTLPIIVQLVKSVQDIWITYNLKLFGNFRKDKIKITSSEIVLLLYGFATLCLSFLLKV
ncbi:hypothetical protein HS7_03780 [Sulfolobales archaeon HS-7]|nr:hypothetical protein HS7_03780 [Sulfolobales archaeon HS-7]